MELAIASLEASTISVEKQTRLLEAQKRTIEDIIRRNKSHKDESSTQSKRVNSSTHEKAQLVFAQTRLTESLRSHVEASTKQTSSVISSILSAVKRTLEKDDRLLEGLEKILPRLSGADTDLSRLSEVDQLCQALVALTSEDIRLQIEAAYSNAARTPTAQVNGTHSSDGGHHDQKEALQAELNELCREIDSLSTMAVDTQYRGPITKALQMARDETRVERMSWSEYVMSVLKYLTTRMDAMDDHFEHAHAHNAAIKTISAALEATITAANNPKPSSGVAKGSPAKRLDQKGLKPLKLVQANLSENQDPVVQLLRGLDVRISNSGDSVELERKLYATVEEQRKKLASFEAASERSLADQIAMSLSNADTNVQALLGAVHAQSPFGTARLMDKSIQHAIDGLEESTTALGDEMRATDIEQISRRLKERRQVLMQKWEA